ncbi:Leucine-rich repeat protein kinase family protein [Rhynchospora pubera]|uniref:Leucine-rich repeat protein kinase family protein n=2 Tax=Rhynchospora pubera TaxID=906938 RepID=A0AAV8E993_9POAL|nr:Leucine-rich repeat protein kinase family protein [Rhynchospora pubera]
MRITGLKLSSSGLTGQLSAYFGKLIALQSLDLSSNDLSGYLPSSLGQLTDLSFLDIRGNEKLNTTLPSGLQNKVQDGSLIYRYDIPSPPHPASKKNVIIIAIAVAVPLLVFVAAIVTVFWLKRSKYNQSVAPKPHYELSPIADDPGRAHANIPQGDNPRGNYAGQAMTTSPQSKGAGQINLPKFEKRQFSYYDIKGITDGFKKSIGTGGYGNVYLGLLENGFQVAVKTRSHTSAQGEKEFLAEAENLTRVHHRNLVSLLGYCIDKNCMALVYEYMQEGNLYDKLKDNASPLDWKQRLRIAYGSALGLEYLHTACNPPLIHRDVKTSNILLNANLEAKIADFGLSKAFNHDAKSPLSTRVVGTLGYLDPEYYTSHQLSEKSDVFSFGVVLLEIITGRPPIITGIEGGNLVEWVRRKLSIADIKSIVDPRMHDKYDVNSVWKVTELACKCTEYASSRRPTMTVVAAELKESLDLELSTEGMHDENAIELVTDVSQDALSEMAYMVRMTNQGPAVR